MKLKILIFLFILSLPLKIRGQENRWVPSDYKNKSFKEFASAAGDLLKIKFFYKDEWVKDLKIGDYPPRFTLTQVLDSLFNGTTVYYYTDKHGNVVITKDYKVKIPGISAGKKTSYIPQIDNSGTEKSHQKSGNTLVEIGNPAERNSAGKATVSGYITNSETKEPVAGATIFNQRLSAGTVSNAYGYYTLTLPRGIHNLQFSFIGMKEKTVDVNLYGTGEMNVEMTETLIPLKETVISAQKNAILRRFEVGVEKINITSFRLSPTSMGESDIVKSILMIPGVKTVGEGSAGFNVRGGSSDQNLILLYGAPVYNSSHFFGFFSAVNSDIIRDVTLYKGGIPAKYGGRISSVLDISTAEGNKKGFRGSAGISPITTHLMIEGPLIRDTLSLILTARSTYSNWIFKLIDNKNLKNSRASFYDINGKVTWDMNKSNKIETAFYFSHDAFRLGTDSLYKYDNNIIAFRWRHIFNSTFFSDLSINNSFYKYNVSSLENITESFILSHKVNSTGLKADFNWFRGKSELNFGLDIDSHVVLPGSYIPANDSSIVEPHYIQRDRALESAIYFEDKFPLTDFLSVSAGMRLSSFLSFGPGSVYLYRPGLAKEKATIIDTLNFRSGQISKKYLGPELRVSLNFRTSDKNSIKINYNRTRQYFHLLTNSTSISPTDTWKLSDYSLKPQIGDQVALGFYQMLFRNIIEASAEIYYKRINNMVDFKGGANLIMNDNIEEEIVNTEGKAYGMEFLFKKTEGKVRFSVGYTFARTFMRSLSNITDEIINDGKWFPSNFDKPNDLVVTMNYIFSRRFSFSADYTYNTGRPITYPVSTYHMYDDLLIFYSDRNKYRIPDYSRLDLSFRVGGSLRVRRIAHPNWTFSVYNLLGRKNVYSVYFKKDGDVVNGYKLSVFGKAIPSVTFNFDF
jgi:hypothetical protein